MSTIPISPALTRDLLRRHLREGLSPREIAERYRLSPAAVRARIRRLPPAGSVPPADLLRDLTRSLETSRRLLEACDAWLRDPDDPTRYTLLPRAEEVVVTVAPREGGRASRFPLAALLETDDPEPSSPPADRRRLLLRTLGELRRLVAALRLLAGPWGDPRLMSELRGLVLACLERLPPAEAALLAASLRRTLLEP